MSELLFCYTGQGGLPPEGFGNQFFEQPSPARDILELALKSSPIPNYDLQALYVDGKDQYGHHISDVRVGQSIQVAHSIAAERFFTDTQDSTPVFIRRLPHSLGLFSAMIAAQGYHENPVRNIEIGMNVVNQRGLRTAEVPPGKMAAVLTPNTDREAFQALCAQYGVNIAVINGQGFYTISGSEAGITAVTQVLTETATPGLKVTPLTIERAFHHPVQMREARQLLEADFQGIPLRQLNGVMILSTGEVTNDPQIVWGQQMSQLTDTYDWDQAKTKAISLGATEGFEMGGNRIKSTEVMNKRRGYPSLEISSVTNIAPVPQYS